MVSYHGLDFIPGFAAIFGVDQGGHVAASGKGLTFHLADEIQHAAPLNGFDLRPVSAAILGLLQVVFTLIDG